MKQCTGSCGRSWGRGETGTRNDWHSNFGRGFPDNGETSRINVVITQGNRSASTVTIGRANPARGPPLPRSPSRFAVPAPATPRSSFAVPTPATPPSSFAVPAPATPPSSFSVPAPETPPKCYAGRAPYTPPLNSSVAVPLGSTVPLTPPTKRARIDASSSSGGASSSSGNPFPAASLPPHPTQWRNLTFSDQIESYYPEDVPTFHFKDLQPTLDWHLARHLCDICHQATELRLAKCPTSLGRSTSLVQMKMCRQFL